MYVYWFGLDDILRTIRTIHLTTVDVCKYIQVNTCMYVYFANLGQDKNTPHMRANSSPLDYKALVRAQRQRALTRESVSDLDVSSRLGGLRVSAAVEDILKGAAIHATHMAYRFRVVN